MHANGERSVSLGVLRSGERTVCLLVLRDLVLVLLALLLDLVVVLLVVRGIVPLVLLLDRVWSAGALLAELALGRGAVLLRSYDALANRVRRIKWDLRIIGARSAGLWERHCQNSAKAGL